jgi:hypothetical protein
MAKPPLQVHSVDVTQVPAFGPWLQHMVPEGQQEGELVLRTKHPTVPIAQQTGQPPCCVAQYCPLGQQMGCPLLSAHGLMVGPHGLTHWFLSFATKPGGQVLQLPAELQISMWNGSTFWQTAPHPPQLLGSLKIFTQPPLQQRCPDPQAGSQTQAKFAQEPPAGQVLPQEPQWFGSELTLMQPFPQSW